MLDTETLKALKEKMPRGYANAVIDAYKLNNAGAISRWTIDRFFKGETYNEKVHAAILAVASKQSFLKAQTTDLING